MHLDDLLTVTHALSVLWGALLCLCVHHVRGIVTKKLPLLLPKLFLYINMIFSECH